ncbi:hypothetical protein ALC62_08874, partial [Cyphomyrmex costatus]
CQINPFYCPTKFAEAYNGDRQPLHAPSPSYLSFHSATYIYLSPFFSFSFHHSRALYHISVPLARRFHSTSVSQQSYTDPKTLVDLFAACNWPISLEPPLNREELPTVVTDLSPIPLLTTWWSTNRNICLHVMQKGPTKCPSKAIFVAVSLLVHTTRTHCKLLRTRNLSMRNTSFYPDFPLAVAFPPIRLSTRTTTEEDLSPLITRSITRD